MTGLSQITAKGSARGAASYPWLGSEPEEDI